MSAASNIAPRWGFELPHLHRRLILRASLCFSLAHFSTCRCLNTIYMLRRNRHKKSARRTLFLASLVGCERVAITRNCAILNSFAKGLTESILNSFLQLFLQNCDSLTPDSFGKGAYWVDSSTLNSWIAHTLQSACVARYEQADLHVHFVFFFFGTWNTAQ